MNWERLGMIRRILFVVSAYLLLGGPRYVNCWGEGQDNVARVRKILEGYARPCSGRLATKRDSVIHYLGEDDRETPGFRSLREIIFPSLDTVHYQTRFYRAGGGFDAATFVPELSFRAWSSRDRVLHLWCWQKPPSAVIQPESSSRLYQGVMSLPEGCLWRLGKAVNDPAARVSAGANVPPTWTRGEWFVVSTGDRSGTSIFFRTDHEGDMAVVREIVEVGPRMVAEVRYTLSDYRKSDPFAFPARFVHELYDSEGKRVIYRAVIKVESLQLGIEVPEEAMAVRLPRGTTVGDSVSLGHIKVPDGGRLTRGFMWDPVMLAGSYVLDLGFTIPRLED